MLRALLIAAALLVAAPASAGAVVVGIGDQKPDMFGDPRFHALQIKHARLTVPWDAMRHGWQVAEIDAWMNAARAHGVHPLVSFGHSRVRRRELPQPHVFAREFRKVRARYPWVWNFATWNEANHCGEPVCRRERLAASYHRKLQLECPRCRILAAEVLDMPNMLKWVRRFRRAYRRYDMGEPRIWGLHNYVEANRFRARSVRQLLRHAKGTVWLTEVGGIVKRRNINRHSVRGIPESRRHAARVTRFLLRRVIPRYRRVTRIYLYHWNSSTRRDSWDSAFIGPDDRVRPALRVLRRHLRRMRGR
ncbi:MAG TPA: hypothetical protein VGR12_00625 [Solirubrobacteraceae bacterium]|nr:hypothetical protein [Solirubrobacteraceae bacterium]